MSALPAAPPLPTASREARREALRRQVMDGTPWFYSPWLHLGWLVVVGLGIAGAALSFVRQPTALELLFPLFIFVVANATEWRAHKSLLHKRVPGFGMVFEQHTPMHHGIFVTDDMSIRSFRELRMVLIPPYGVVLIAVAVAPIAWVLHRVGETNLAALFVATCMLYVVSYELFHLTYHLRPDGPIGGLRLVRALRRHHATHHDPEKMQRWNFNVTIPLWDWVRGTIWREGRA